VSGCQGRGLDILAFTAARETGGEVLSNNGEALAVLMLMQLNNARTGDGNASVNGVTWRQLGTHDFSSVQPDPTQVRIIDLAELLLAGYCDYNQEPLALFEYANEVAIAVENRQTYPSIGQNITKLRSLASDDRKLFEVSFNIDNLPDLLEDINRPEPVYNDPYIVVVPGADRGILVGEADVTDLNIFYQCAGGTVPVLREGVNPVQRGKREGVHFDCTTCPRENRIWWWSDGGKYEEMSDAEFQTRRREQGGAGYIKSCNA